MELSSVVYIFVKGFISLAMKYRWIFSFWFWASFNRMNWKLKQNVIGLQAPLN